MSNRAASFVEQWVSENAVKPVEGAPSGDDSEARLRAEACLAAAKDEGIAREDIEEETGDLVPASESSDSIGPEAFRRNGPDRLSGRNGSHAFARLY
jgi:hypothetical protein